MWRLPLRAGGALAYPRAGVYPHNGTALLRLKTMPGYVPARMRLWRLRRA